MGIFSSLVGALDNGIGAVLETTAQASELSLALHEHRNTPRPRYAVDQEVWFQYQGRVVYGYIVSSKLARQRGARRNEFYYIIETEEFGEVGKFEHNVHVPRNR